MSYIFSDRYQVVKTLYQSTATEVLLVKSLEVDELLVAKCIRKQQTSTDIFLEANLLQELRHPGIPQFYEIIEDKEFLYILQEYVFGIPLNHYLLYHQHISQEMFLKVAIEICEIVEYLHTHRPSPVLYLDMKPSHIIVCKEQVKLIDFGIANFLSNSGKIIQKFGTKKYAAPEQMSGQRLSLATDVYGVGKVLMHMLKFLEPKKAVFYMPLVWRATRKNSLKRIQSVSVVKQQLIQKQHKKNRKNKNKKHLEKVIAVVGSDRGVGCTHIAIALVSYLNQAGLDAYYRNCTEQRVLEQLVLQEPVSVEKDGFIYHENFRGILQYDPRKEKSPSNGIQVIDCGSNGCPQNADATIYVCGGRLWQKQKDIHWLWGDEEVIICNFFSRFLARRFAREINKKVVVYPFQKDPFVINKALQLLFSKIIKNIL